ncbi:alpha/beta hydrolase [Actinomadura parmotrematis]|uniref:Alpha/beta hydrolase n=1 Tax=Actinomadura parmotrematis TaxID=2864039 RepID=A0ABS7G3V4_9ACTN|nr:alpha/beta hydrolase [Actinomadura parmotrematis]MBW8487382.1 alpha/beta hydrolase [Actinomadura parmotrematis]
MTFPLELLAPPDPAALPLPAPAPPGVRVLRGVPYRVLDGTRPLELDLWLPASGGPHPLVVLVHGGAWRTGLRGDLGPRLRAWDPSPHARLVAAGFAVACPSYRLSGEAPHPAQVDDLTAALGWLRARAGELGVDAGRTVLWGESAGGHLAALAALRAPVRGCVAWYAPTDLTGAAPGSFEALLAGADLAAASPARHAGPDAPPFLVLHGADDAIVPSWHATRLAGALDAAGVPVELDVLPGADHLWVGLPDAAVEDVFARSLAFARDRTR